LTVAFWWRRATRRYGETLSEWNVTEQKYKQIKPIGNVWTRLNMKVREFCSPTEANESIV
jgi:hypothetical protein